MDKDVVIQDLTAIRDAGRKFLAEIDKFENEILGKNNEHVEELDKLREEVPEIEDLVVDLEHIFEELDSL